MELCWHTIGDWSVTKIWELDLGDYAPETLLPGLEPSMMAAGPSATDQRLYDPATNTVPLSVHTWLLRGGGKTILIDTGVGNDKDRPTMKPLDHLHTPFLERLAQAGTRPSDVDYVLLTHIHADHVGWNTQRLAETWTPTFPRATVLCSDLEYRYGVANASGDEPAIRAVRADAGLGEPVRSPVAGVFADSVQPIEAAGLLRRIVVDGGEALEGIRFLPTPGHSIDHASISVASRGRHAVFGGDVLHHPVELTYPQLISMFCEFPDATRRARRALLERVADTDTLYFSSHFAGSSVGRIERSGATYKWSFVEGDSASAAT